MKKLKEEPINPFGNMGIQRHYYSQFDQSITATVNIGPFSQPQLYNYRYDQLNRLVAMDVFRGLNESTNTWDTALTATGDYSERIRYDGNGNILKYLRQGYGSKLAMDSLSYKYNAGTNRLNYVRDRMDNSVVHSGNYTEDIDDQDINNYGYDAVGNLTRDDKEGISSIEWTVYGKIKKITKTDGTVISYTYDRWSGEGSAYVESVRKAFGGSGVYFRELEGVNGNLGANNLGFKNNPRLTDALFVAKYGQKPVQSLNTDHRIANAVAQIVQDATQNPLDPSEKVNLIGTSMGAVTTAQAALYILEHKKELGLSEDFKIDNVILAGSAVNANSRLYKRLQAAIKNQIVNGKKFEGQVLSGTVDANGENGYNYPEELDGVTGLAGRNKVGMVFRFGRLVGQIIRGLKFGKTEKGKFGVTGLDHLHTNAADDSNFGDGLIKQALIMDQIEGEKGKEGAEKYLKDKNGG